MRGEGGGGEGTQDAQRLTKQNSCIHMQFQHMHNPSGKERKKEGEGGANWSIATFLKKL